MNYKAICTDLDGTLLGASSELTAENAAAIEEITRRGVLFVPSTGRTVAEMPPEVKDNENVRYIMYSNGAGLIDKKTGLRSERLLSAEKTAEIFKAVEPFEALIVFHKDTNCYADAKRLDRAEKYNISKAYANIFQCGIRVENGFDEYKYTVGAVEMICIFLAKGVSREECVSALSGIEGIIVTTSGGNNIEVMSSAAGKGNAVKCFAELVGIPRESIICVGDSMNDSAMLDVAGLPLAVGNADEGLKPHAKRVICSNVEHTAKYILENILSGGNE